MSSQDEHPTPDPNLTRSVATAVAEAVVALVRGPDVATQLPHALRLLGEATDASLVCVHENVRRDGQLAHVVRSEWTASGYARSSGDGEDQGGLYDPDQERYVRVLGSGGIIAEPSEDAPSVERARLERDGVLSHAILPIFVGDAWWGYLGLEDRRRARRWSQQELGELRVVAATIGAALGPRGLDPSSQGADRPVSEVSLEEIERRYRTFIEQAPNIVIYADHPDQNSTSSYASPQIETILGVTPERWIEAEGTELWFSMLHPDDLERVQRQYEDYLQGGPDVDDYRMIRPDGGVVWIRDRARLVPDANGQLVEWGVMMDVTNMRGMEDRLREAEARYRTLVEQLPAFVYSEDSDGRMLYASPRSQEILGVPADQWLNDPDLWRKMLVEEDRDRALSWAARHEDVTQGYADEYRLLRPDGTVVWIRDEAAPIFDEDGQFERWQGLMVDISEQKHAQELVRVAETKFRLLVEQIGAATYIDVPEGPTSTIYISPQIEAITGYTPEEWVADQELWEKCLHPEDRERSIAQAHEAVRTLEPYLNEHRMITRDGRTIWVRDEEHVVLDEHGQPEYWLGVLVDVTEQREALQRVREAEAKFQVLVEEIPVITYIDSIDLERGPRYISPQLESILGYPPERWLEDPAAWKQIVHPDDLDRQAGIFAEADRTLEPYAIDYRALASDGRTVWLHEEAHVVRDEQGEPLYWLGAVQDISTRKETEELERALAREKQATAKLRALDEMKDQFLAGISHDLRTPLASILGFTLTMEQAYHRLSDDQRLEFIGRITANARKLEELVNDLLDIHRLNQGVLVVQHTPTDIGTLVEELVQHADYLADHAVEVDVASVVIPVDVTKVRRMVENLLTNTARHTPAGTQVWVRVTASPEGALITIADSGPGVPDEEKDELFKEFATGANTRGSSSPGIGVGLSLVARFAELHGGRAWVEDRDGGGAVFLVHLPANPPSSSS